jgi:hypothetical protein
MYRCFILVAFVVPILVRGAVASDVTSCGATIGAGETGVLQADLDCTAGAYGVRLLPAATLDLNGHRLSVGLQADAAVVGVRNAGDPIGSGSGNFTIVGPGEIAGDGQELAGTIYGTYGCIVLNDGRARITSPTGTVDIHGCIYGVVGSSSGGSPNGGRLVVDHASLHDNVFDGVAVSRLAASDVDASSNGGQGLGAYVVQLLNVTANDNPRGHGVFGAQTLKGVNVTANRNYTGAECWRTLKVRGLVASENVLFGAAGGKVRLVGSTVESNGVADVQSVQLPQLVDTTCGTSMDHDGASWGICAGE